MSDEFVTGFLARAARRERTQSALRAAAPAAVLVCGPVTAAWLLGGPWPVPVTAVGLAVVAVVAGLAAWRTPTTAAVLDAHYGLAEDLETWAGVSTGARRTSMGQWLTDRLRDRLGDGGQDVARRRLGAAWRIVASWVPVLLVLILLVVLVFDVRGVVPFVGGGGERATQARAFDGLSRAVAQPDDAVTAWWRRPRRPRQGSVVASIGDDVSVRLDDRVVALRAVGVDFVEFVVPTEMVPGAYSVHVVVDGVPVLPSRELVVLPPGARDGDGEAPSPPEPESPSPEPEAQPRPDEPEPPDEPTDDGETDPRGLLELARSEEFALPTWSSAGPLTEDEAAVANAPSGGGGRSEPPPLPLRTGTGAETRAPELPDPVADDYARALENALRNRWLRADERGVARRYFETLREQERR